MSIPSRLRKYMSWWEGGLVLFAQLRERDIHNRIFAPIFVIEMPPLFGIDGETLGFHRATQQGAIGALLGRTACEVAMRAFRHLVVAARHRQRLPGLEVVDG